jgi:hypothetical protein
MKSSCWLIFVVLLYASQVHATAYNSDSYTLPPTKAYIDSCLKKALQLHQGKIEKQSLLQRENHFFVQYEIDAGDGKVWLVSCDLETGNLVEQN